MKLDRHVNKDGKGKYALIKLRYFERMPTNVEEFIQLIRENPNCIDFGLSGTKDEFFVIKLKDRSALPALRAYYADALNYDKEWAEEIGALCHSARKLQPKTQD